MTQAFCVYEDFAASDMTKSKSKCIHPFVVYNNIIYRNRLTNNPVSLLISFKLTIFVADHSYILDDRPPFSPYEYTTPSLKQYLCFWGFLHSMVHCLCQKFHISCITPSCQGNLLSLLSPLVDPGLLVFYQRQERTTDVPCHHGTSDKKEVI